MADSIYCLFLLENGRLATGKANNIQNPKLPTASNEIWDTLLKWMEEKKSVDIRYFTFKK